MTLSTIFLTSACWLPKLFFPGVFVVKFNLCAPNHVCAIRATTGGFRFEFAWADRCSRQTRGKAKVFVKRKSRGRGFAGTTAGRIKKRFKREEGGFNENLSENDYWICFHFENYVRVRNTNVSSCRCRWFCRSKGGRVTRALADEIACNSVVNTNSYWVLR